MAKEEMTERQRIFAAMEAEREQEKDAAVQRRNEGVERREAAYNRVKEAHPEWVEMNEATRPIELENYATKEDYDPAGRVNHGAKGFGQMSFTARRKTAVENGMPTPKGLPTGKDEYRKVVFIGVLSEGDRKGAEAGKDPKDIRVFPRFSFFQGQASGKGLREQSNPALSRSYYYPNGFKDPNGRPIEPAKTRDGKNMIVEGNRMTGAQWAHIVETAKQTEGAYMVADVDKPKYDENNRIIEGETDGKSRKAYVAIAAEFSPAFERVDKKTGITWMNPNSLRINSVEPVTPEHLPDMADEFFEDGKFNMDKALKYDHVRGVAITHELAKAKEEYDARPKPKKGAKKTRSAKKDAPEKDSRLEYLLLDMEEEETGKEADNDREINELVEGLGAPQADGPDVSDELHM